MLIGCSKDSDNDETTAAPETTESEATEDTEATEAAEAASEVNQLYDDLIKELEAVRNGDTDEDGMNALAEKLSVDTIMAPEDAVIYYTEFDIDGNGVDELMIYQHMIIEGGEEVPIIYDVYTVENGELVHVIAGGARNSFYLAADGSFYNMASSGAAYTGYAKYTYSNGQITPVSCYFTDDKTGDVLWYHSDAGLWADDSVEATEEEANAFFDFDYMFIANESEI